MTQKQPTPEQLKEMQERLSKMSPEELLEFQKKQCIFCHIISGKVQSKKIYEDDVALGILDINPANPGHVLLLPKQHYSIMPQLPHDVLSHLSIVAKKISSVLLSALEAKGSNIIIANGVAAGQKAQHFMMHVIPRQEKDGILFALPQKQQEEAELNALAERLAKSLGQQAVPKSSSLPIPAISQKIKEAEHVHHHERKRVQRAKEEKPAYQKKEQESIQKQKTDEGQKSTGASLDDIARIFGGAK